jgi:hypothetical protein
MADYITTTIANADKVREALGRALAKVRGASYPIVPDVVVPNADGSVPEGLTLYYEDPVVSADGLNVAFKVAADIVPELGKQVTLTNGSKITPSATVMTLNMTTWAKPR